MILHERYRITDILGQGGFGIVYLAIDIWKADEVAVKEYFPNGQAVRDERSRIVFPKRGEAGHELFLNEASIMGKVKDLAETPVIRDFILENNTAYIVMEYWKGVTLREWIGIHGKMEIQDCLLLLRPLMKCLDRIHGRGILHRDICPENIMVSDVRAVKIIDFGSAIELGNHNPVILEPTYRKGYSPPEQYEKNRLFGPWSDVYSLCAVIYFCFTGLEPQDAMERMKSDQLLEEVAVFDFKGEEDAAEVLKKGMAAGEEGPYLLRNQSGRDKGNA